jgi:hypothetical protein
MTGSYETFLFRKPTTLGLDRPLARMGTWLLNGCRN